MSRYRRMKVENGMYFITAVLQNRKANYLIRYIDEFRAAYKETQSHCPFETIALCILPNHFHLIMQLPEHDMNFSKRIRLLKLNFTKRLPLECRQPTASHIKRREAGIWQRRFWEHLIRDDQDLVNHWDYIYYNPVKHGYVQAVKDWAYSSFHRDVKRDLFPEDWGGHPELMIKGEI